MEVFLTVLGIILSLLGIVGCIIPGLPGPPLNFIALLCISFIPGYSTMFYVCLGVLSIVVFLFDYFVPILFAKKIGATRSGITGGIAGMLIGIFFSPVGMILGLILGSVIGDMVGGKKFNSAFKSGIASAFGTLITIGLKLTVSGWMTWVFFTRIYNYYISSPLLSS